VEGQAHQARESGSGVDRNGGCPAFIGKAEITNDDAVVSRILTDFHSKYWQNRVLGVGPSRAGFDSGERIAIRITPTRDLPDGFTSAPSTKAPPLEAVR
jgi:hypothetical protein